MVMLKDDLQLVLYCWVGLIKTKGRGPYKQYYITEWLNWPTKFNSWVKASDVKDF